MKNFEVGSFFHPHTVEFRDFSHGVFWRFRLVVASLPGSDRWDGGGQTAAGPWWGWGCSVAVCFKHWLINMSPNIVPSPYETPELFFNLAIFGIWGHPGHPCW